MPRRWIRPAIGAALCVLVVGHVRWDAMAETLAAVGPWFALVAALDIAGMVCDAAAIRELAGQRTSFATAFVAQASGYLVNRLTPGSTLGEPLKIAQLSREAPRDVAVSAIVLYNVATFGVGVVVIAIGAPLALLSVRIPAPLATAVWVTAALLAGVLAVLLVFVRRGPLSRVVCFARRIAPSRAGAWRDPARRIDAQLAAFGDRASRRGVLLVSASRALAQLGTLVLLHALGADDLAVPVLSLGIAIGWISNVMPLGLGVADGGHYALFAAFGAAAPLGVAFAMVDRARASLLALFALVAASACHPTSLARTTVIEEYASPAVDRLH